MTEKAWKVLKIPISLGSSEKETALLIGSILSSVKEKP